MVNIRAGSLRRRVTFQRATEARDAHGEPVATWAAVAVRWASVELLAGVERFAEDRERATRFVRFRVRWDTTVDTITPKDRVSWDSRTFDIQHVTNQDERNAVVLVDAEELAS